MSGYAQRTFRLMMALSLATASMALAADSQIRLEQGDVWRVYDATGTEVSRLTIDDVVVGFDVVAYHTTDPASGVDGAAVTGSMSEAKDAIAAAIAKGATAERGYFLDRAHINFSAVETLENEGAPAASEAPAAGAPGGAVGDAPEGAAPGGPGAPGPPGTGPPSGPGGPTAEAPEGPGGEGDAEEGKQGLPILPIAVGAILVIAIVLFVLKKRGGAAGAALDDMPEAPETEEADTEDAGTEGELQVPPPPDDE